tara:strand:- start:58 stop:768 length:711 start_codon:yes stop_codon:yes gene_type:complete
MANFQFDNVHIDNGKLLVCKDGVTPKALGKKSNEGKHSAYIEGPLQVGDVGDFSKAQGTVMIGKDGNRGSKYPLYVKGNAFFDHPNIGDLSSRFNTADKKPKPFDMDHPSKGKGYRLRYACIEGPEVGVYYRGRLKNEKKIRLPNYWKDLVHTESITVQLQPIGAHQDIIVKRWDDEYVYLQAQGGLPINCFYHVYAERKDVNALVVEYEGESWSDYPDPSYDDPQFSNKVNTRTA